MSMLVVAIIFGLTVPVCNVISNSILGNNRTEMNEMRKEYWRNHPVAMIIGLVISLIPMATYWWYVITHLAM